MISPLIEESESLDLKNAVALHEELSAYFANSATVALMHGRMKNDEKEAIMQDFKSQKVRFWYRQPSLKLVLMSQMRPL